MDTALVYCGPHSCVVDDADVKEKRRDFADDYARDAAREGFER